ncbi:ABC transporter ATP-binding protein [Clostridium folliculivorans]|uniref:Sugar ABC transporter ATP-binding protein n=1 Tax=Clostridium folliculivorans TaxID=2886038 RepID=A0A9W5Y2R3_9CLOT|nr:ABC transporter ATP-binding protein [Clostridium folliculivorans]GKU25541.1 sugar ABC transporter ATP-binding protein [Clostridium folliculivorans]GKU28564.1 sugar ABC transporter ATP-binding protein [Clostridium folliculivorans]
MKNETLIRVLRYVKRYRIQLILVIAFALASNILSIVAPFFTGKAIDYMVDKGQVNFSAILKIVVLLSIIYGLSAVLQWFLSIFTNVISNRTVKDIRDELFEKLNTMPLKYYDSKAHGDIISRFTNDIDAISEGLLQGITQLFSGIITFVGSLIFMIDLSPVITLVVVVMTPLCFLLSSFIAKNSKKMFREQSKTLGELNGYIEEVIGNQKIVKAFNYEERSEKAFKEINGRLYECGRRAQFFSSLTNPGTRYINNITYILSGIIGAIVSVAGGFSIGKISSFLIYSNQFAKPINDITSITTQLQSAMASAERVFAILDEQGESLEQNNQSINKSVEGKVEFENVSFAYKKDRPLIEGLSMNIKPGSTVAIVGPTGAGKTTLVNLLMRFYEIDKGKISIDGKDIKEVSKESLRSSFGMVLQESWLFAGTIRENIAYGKPDATDEAIINASKAAYAHSFIKRLPKGYDTLITEDGANLSQGQRQLLTIARVMLMNPSMLILDEATSSIDTLTEARIQKAFLSLMKGRTSFVIAHRLSTIREADLILVMKDGKIIEQGSHGELLIKNGFYAKLYNSQYAVAN